MKDVLVRLVETISLFLLSSLVGMQLTEFWTVVLVPYRTEELVSTVGLTLCL